MALRKPKRKIAIPWLWLLLAGLATGVFAGVAVLLYHVLDGVLRGDGPWAFANLIASGLFPSRAFSRAFSRATLAGMSFHVIASGLAGVVFSLILSRYLNRPRRCLLVSLALAVAGYYLMFRFVWPGISPVVVIYQPFPGMIMGHLLYGFFMGFYPKVALKLGPLRSPAPESPFL